MGNKRKYVNVNHGQKPKKLLELAREVLRRKHYSIHMEETYIGWMVRYIHFHNKRHLKDMGVPEIEAFLTHLADGFGHVYLPYALARKYKNADKEWGWQYVFPAKGFSKDPRSGIIRRHHIHEHSLQKALKQAVTPHTFRHQHMKSWEEFLRIPAKAQGRFYGGPRLEAIARLCLRR